MSHDKMGRFVDKLRNGSAAHAVVVSGEGFSLVPLEGAEDQFNALAREVMARSGQDFVAFPTTDGGTGYESVFVMPLE